MKKTVLIADSDEQFGPELAKALDRCAEFEVAGLASDGEQAMQMVKSKRPDILVLDLLLTRMDGLTILDQLRELYSRPQILVTSAFMSDYVAATAVRLGVKQVLLKPCNVDVVVKNLQRMAAGERGGPVIFLWNGEKSLESLVTRILHDIGVPASIKGYQYLREAIVLASRDSDSNKAILKNRYCEVAAIFETTPKKVESAVRHAIEVAWDRGDLDTLQSYFGYTVSNTKGKPTNTEFISIIADQIRLWLKENSEALE